MSKLTSRVRSIVGPIKCSSGRGAKWFWVGDGKTRTNSLGLVSFIDKMKANFETWVMTRSNPTTNQIVVDYIFIIKSKTGQFVGACQTDDWSASDTERFILVNYTETFKTESELHEYNKNYSNVVSYVRLT